MTLLQNIIEKKFPLDIDHNDPKVQESFRIAPRLTVPTVMPFSGRGIVIAGGGKYFPSTWVAINALRHHGCKLPVQVWYMGEELNRRQESLLEELGGVKCIDAFKVRETIPCRILKGWTIKPYAICYSSFAEVMYIDADNTPVKDPSYLFDSKPYKACGSYFFPDQIHPTATTNDTYFITQHTAEILGVPYPGQPSFESGQLLVDKSKCWRELQLTMWWNEFSDYTYKHLYGDKDTFRLGFLQTKKEYFLSPHLPIVDWAGLLQKDHTGEVLFLHRGSAKWKTDRNPVANRPQEALLQGFLKSLVVKLNGVI